MSNLRELTSVRVTCVKPGRIVEVLTTASPGIEPVYCETYVRRIHLPCGSPILAALEAAGYVRSPISNAVEPETAHE